MTIELERDALVTVLRQVIDVVEARTTIPILSNVLLAASAAQLTVTGTDLDIEVSASCPCAGEMSTTVDARKLLAAVTSLSGGRVTIAPAAGRTRAVTIKAGRGVRTLSALPVDDFPLRGAPTAATTYPLKAAALLRILDTCGIAQCTDEVRYYLVGVYLHRVGQHLVGAATDGHRLVRTEVPAPPESEGSPQVIVPTKGVTILRKLLAKASSAEVSVSVSERAIEITAGTVRVCSKTVDGSFPDYSRVIPDSDGEAMTISTSRDVLMSAVGGVAAVIDADADKKTRAVKMDFRPGALASVNASDQNGSAASEEFEADVAPAPVIVGMNARYVTSTLAVFSEGAALMMRVTDPKAAVRFWSDKDPDLTVIIMPMCV